MSSAGKHKRDRHERRPATRRVLKVICTWEFYDWRVSIARHLGVDEDMQSVFAAGGGVDSSATGYWVCEMPEVFEGAIVVGALSDKDRDRGVVEAAMRTEVMVRAEDDHGIELLGLADGEFDTDVEFITDDES